MILDERYLAIDLLRALKKYLTYSELEEYLQIPAPGLWRYVNAKIIPTREKAREILSRIIEYKLVSRVIKTRLRIVEEGIVNTYNVIYDPSILKLLGYEAYSMFKDYKPTLIMSAEVDGIPLAISVAEYFDSKVLIVKKRREAGFKDYIEYAMVSRDIPAITTLYAPKELFNRGDKVLIVDDLLRTGRTCNALIEIAREAKVDIVGVFAAIAVGYEWTKHVRNTRVHVVFQVEAL